MVDGAVTGEIGLGLAVFVGIERTDEAHDAQELARKVAHLRIFDDDRGKFADSLLDTSGSALVVSQFTLVANTEKGNRPSFSDAAPPEQAEPLYEEFCAALAAEGTRIETGVFGARMAVALVNQGPVTIVLG
jgi:D-tyrosyl-tRNA(Tyr) deacylase